MVERYTCDLCNIWDTMPLDDKASIYIHIALEHSNNYLMNYIKTKTNIDIENDFVKIIEYMEKHKLGYKTVLEGVND